MLRIAMGALGWSYEETMWTPPRFLFLAIEGYYDEEERRHIAMYEAVRLHSATILASLMPKGKRINVTDVMSFPWDEKEEEKEQKRDPWRPFDHLPEKMQERIRRLAANPPRWAGDTIGRTRAKELGLPLKKNEK